DLGFQEAWQVCSKWTRKKREEERREEVERKRAESERSRVERERRRAEMEAADAAKQLAEAEIDSLDFPGLHSYLFFDRRRLSLEEIKRGVAAWDSLRTLKERVRLWPEAVNPDLAVAARRDIEGWFAARRLSPAWELTPEEALIDRAAQRLASVICSNL